MIFVCDSLVTMNLTPAALIEYFFRETSESQFIGNDSILNDPATQFKKTATKKTTANMMMAKKWLWKTLRAGRESQGGPRALLLPWNTTPWSKATDLNPEMHLVHEWASPPIHNIFKKKAQCKTWRLVNWAISKNDLEERIKQKYAKSKGFFYYLFF